MVMMTLLAIVPHVSSAERLHRLLQRRRRVGGAELHRLLPLELDRVDRATICLAPASLAPWMALAPMPPTPTTATVSPGPTSAAYTLEPQPVTTPQPSRQALSSGTSFVDLDAARLVDDGVVGERAEQAHQPEVLALRVVADGAVGDLPADAHQRAEVAQVLVAGRAARTATTGRDEAEHDVVAGREPADALADLFDDAGALVATDDRQLERQVTGDEVLVGVAHARRGELDQHLARSGGVEFDVLDAPRLVRFPEDCGFRLHTRTVRQAPECHSHRTQCTT